MTREYIAIPEGSSVVELGLERRASWEGQLPPLKATLSWGIFGASDRNQHDYIEWGTGEYGAKNATLRFEPSLFRSRKDDAILVEVTHLTNGYINEANSKTIIGLMDEHEIPLFGMDENTTFTQGESLELWIVLKNGSVEGEAPSLIEYSYKTVIHKDFQKYISHPTENNGIVRFRRGETSHSIQVPVSWKSLPAQARFSIEMTLTPLFKARLQKSGIPFLAAHVLGTQRGVCPPGSSKSQAETIAGANHEMYRGEELNVTIGDAQGLLSIHGRYPDSISLYRNRTELTDDIVAVVDTDIDSIQMCTSFPVDVHVEGKGTGDALVPLETNVLCSKGKSEYKVNLNIGWDNVILRKDKYSNESGGNVVTLTVRRKADEQHALLESLEVVPSHGRAIIACGLDKPIVTLKNTETSEIAVKNAYEECTPSDIVRVELESDVESVQIIPRLLVRGVPGVRVEINGQVVMYSGNDDMSQKQDSDANPFSGGDIRNIGSIMADAYILNIPQGFEIPVEIVIFAEDGTTSSTITIKLRKKSPSSKVSRGTTEVSTNPLLETILEGLSDFEQCKVCTPGWVSALPDSPRCAMCPPGTFAEYDGVRCSSCSEGTYSMSWGSRKCKHCIEGTFAPHTGSSSCKVCPESTTTQGDGRASCDAPVRPLDVRGRYAVLIHVSVKLSGIDEDTLILKSGVSGSPDRLLSHLVASDMAKAFNTTTSAVNVKSIRRLSDRNFETNISASLPVYIPPSATEDDISTALQIERLSADSPLEMLAKSPDSFFGQTTDILQAHVESTEVHTEDHFPERDDDLVISLLVIGSLGILGGMMIAVVALKKQRGLSNGEDRFLLPRQEKGPKE